MSDTFNNSTEPLNSDLDEYGVWIKEPQKKDENESQDFVNIDDNLPDFSFLDNLANADNNQNASEENISEENGSQEEVPTDFDFETEHRTWLRFLQTENRKK